MTEQLKPCLNPDESDPVTLWAEIWRLREAIKGPDGYATWQEAATAERVQRMRLERKQLRGALVTVAMTVFRDGSIESDVQTHDNCWADVHCGLAAVAKESERVLQSAVECPHFPKSKQEAHTPVIRRAQPAQAVPVLSESEKYTLLCEHGLMNSQAEKLIDRIEQAVRAKMGASNLVESHQIKPVEIDGIKPGIVGKEGA